MKVDFSLIRFPDEEATFVDDRIPYEEILEVINAGLGTDYERTVVSEWKRRQNKKDAAA